MGIFTPPDSCFFNSETARLWLVAAMVGLAVMGVALLALAGVLWRRMTRVHAVWWQRLPLVLLLVWAGGCLFYAVQAFISARSVSLPPQFLLPGRRGVPLYCYPALLGGQAQIALIGAACLLALGWLALSALARRGRAA